MTKYTNDEIQVLAKFFEENFHKVKIQDEEIKRLETVNQGNNKKLNKINTMITTFDKRNFNKNTVEHLVHAIDDELNTLYL
tara:strand:- start:890 stop:1132 length:243 start_codon:yes stop_codon:yes gene_type:complete